MFWTKFLKKKQSKVPTFIHIPKTGGTYLAQRESKGQPALRPLKYLGHTYVVDKVGEKNVLYEFHDPKRASKNVTLASDIQSDFAFATVRNIYEWLVSYAWHAGGWNPKYRDPNHYDFKIAEKGFEYLLKTISDREDIWPNRKFIHAQLFSSGGDLIVDWINHTSALDSGIKSMADHLGITYSKKKRERVGRDDKYTDYYTPELIELVEKTWGRELDLFGFTLEGKESSKVLIPQGMISKGQKNNIKYNWKQDKLATNNDLEKV